MSTDPNQVISIEQRAQSLSDFNPTRAALSLVWLVSRIGTKKYFIATSYEKENAVATLKGFWSSRPLEEIQKTYNDLVANTASDQYIEVSIPWARIDDIQNLAYRHKTKKQ